VSRILSLSLSVSVSLDLPKSFCFCLVLFCPPGPFIHSQLAYLYFLLSSFLFLFPYLSLRLIRRMTVASNEIFFYFGFFRPHSSKCLTPLRAISLMMNILSGTVLETKRQIHTQTRSLFEKIDVILQWLGVK